MKVTARTLAEPGRLAGQLAAAADEPGLQMTAAPGPGLVLARLLAVSGISGGRIDALAVAMARCIL